MCARACNELPHVNERLDEMCMTKIILIYIDISVPFANNFYFICNLVCGCASELLLRNDGYEYLIFL